MISWVREHLANGHARWQTSKERKQYKNSANKSSTDDTGINDQNGKPIDKVGSTL